MRSMLSIRSFVTMNREFRIRVYRNGEVHTVNNFGEGDTLKLSDDHGQFMTLEIIDLEVTIRLDSGKLAGWMKRFRAWVTQ